MFEFVGRLHAINNMLVIDDMYNQYLYNTAEGLVYCFVVDGILFKVGQTSTTMRKRIKSYNCGQSAYRKNGTCSVTNYFILSSLVSMYDSGSDIMLYIWKAYDSVIKTAFGGQYVSSATSAKLSEGELICDFEERLVSRTSYGTGMIPTSLTRAVGMGTSSLDVCRKPTLTTSMRTSRVLLGIKTVLICFTQPIRRVVTIYAMAMVRRDFRSSLVTRLILAGPTRTAVYIKSSSVTPLACLKTVDTFVSSRLIRGCHTTMTTRRYIDCWKGALSSL